MGHVDIFKATLKRQVIDYVTHPDYKRSVLGNDIGIGFLVKPVDFSTTIKKVILKTTALNMEEDGMLMAAGWGAWKVSKIINHVANEKQILTDPALLDSNLRLASENTV